MSKLHTCEMQNHLLKGDGPNPVALYGLMNKDQGSIDNDREYLAMGNAGAQAYITATLDACAKILGASHMDMDTNEGEFIALAKQLAASGAKPEKHGVDGHAVKLIKAYVEVSLLHAFSRGGRLIMAEACDGLREMRTGFSIDTLSRMGERSESAVRACCENCMKADGGPLGFMRSAKKKAAAAEAVQIELASTDKAYDIMLTATNLLARMDGHRMDLKWKAPDPTTLRKLCMVGERHKLARATV